MNTGKRNFLTLGINETTGEKFEWTVKAYTAQEAMQIMTPVADGWQVVLVLEV